MSHNNLDVWIGNMSNWDKWLKNDGSRLSGKKNKRGFDDYDGELIEKVNRNASLIEKDIIHVQRTSKTVYIDMLEGTKRPLYFC